MFKSLVVLVVLCCACCQEARAEEPTVWVSTIARSYHLDREAHYHESNLGLGFELSLNRDWRAIGGHYTNSFRHPSNYAGVAWLPFHPQEHLSIGATALAVTGYNVSPTVMIAPALSYEVGHFGISFCTIGIVSEVQLKVGF